MSSQYSDTEVEEDEELEAMEAEEKFSPDLILMEDDIKREEHEEDPDYAPEYMCDAVASGEERSVPIGRRKPNFTHEETQILVERVSKNESILFGKGSAYFRQQCWLAVAQAVNAVGKNNRDVEDLKKRWRDLKRRSKDKLASFQREQRYIGDRLSSHISSMMSADQLAMSNLPWEVVQGVSDLDTLQGLGFSSTGLHGRSVASWSSSVSQHSQNNRHTRPGNVKMCGNNTASIETNKCISDGPSLSFPATANDLQSEEHTAISSCSTSDDAGSLNVEHTEGKGNRELFLRDSKQAEEDISEDSEALIQMKSRHGHDSDERGNRVQAEDTQDNPPPCDSTHEDVKQLPEDEDSLLTGRVKLKSGQGRKRQEQDRDYSTEVEHEFLEVQRSLVQEVYLLRQEIAQQRVEQSDALGQVLRSHKEQLLSKEQLIQSNAAVASAFIKVGKNLEALTKVCTQLLAQQLHHKHFMWGEDQSTDDSAVPNTEGNPSSVPGDSASISTSSATVCGQVESIDDRGRTRNHQCCSLQTSDATFPGDPSRKRRKT
ncbi:t-SNARE domain-containing protein 1-like isoform X2 [Protopterus annectens]|uniref:t-SNARE domain-containing protein 1-like isoform X2 n=1 Tax=Protopterus annectens TaxID=7888 RepID=UPI001CF9967C|nr:t-SNARE domain-containing protein 1-like isoform X2 [Protopterus annectens]